MNNSKKILLMALLIISIAVAWSVKEVTVVQATAHTHSGGTATCTTPAKCSVCGKSYGSPLGHDLTGWIWTNNGAHGSLTHYKECKRCTAEFYVNTHNFGGWYTVRAQTCTEGGIKKSSCGTSAYTRTS